MVHLKERELYFSTELAKNLKSRGWKRVDVGVTPDGFIAISGNESGALSLLFVARKTSPKSTRDASDVSPVMGARIVSPRLAQWLRTNGFVNGWYSSMWVNGDNNDTLYFSLMIRK